MGSKVNVNEIFRNHKSTLLNGDGKMIKSDKKFFILYPIVIGLILVLLVRIPSDSLNNIFAICLSIFIGLFLNLLVLIISFAENKLNVPDKKNRAILLEQTFYNITYTIIASLIALGLLFISNIKILPASWSLDITHITNYFHIQNLKEVQYNKVINLTFYFVFYTVFTHIIMTLLMVVKRIFKLFKVEIDEINKKLD
jgi:hypothetical protein